MSEYHAVNTPTLVGMSDFNMVLVLAEKEEDGEGKADHDEEPHSDDAEFHGLKQVLNYRFRIRARIPQRRMTRMVASAMKRFRATRFS